MGMYDEVSGIMSKFPKKDITEALVRGRTKNQRDRESVLRLEREYRELVEALGLLPENTSHLEALKRAHFLYDNVPKDADPGPALE